MIEPKFDGTYSETSDAIEFQLDRLLSNTSSNYQSCSSCSSTSSTIDSSTYCHLITSDDGISSIGSIYNDFLTGFNSDSKFSESYECISAYMTETNAAISSSEDVTSDEDRSSYTATECSQGQDQILVELNSNPFKERKHFSWPTKESFLDIEKNEDEANRCSNLDTEKPNVIIPKKRKRIRTRNLDQGRRSSPTKYIFSNTRSIFWLFSKKTEPRNI